MLTSKIIKESVENHCECCGCVNSCAINLFQIDFINHEIPYDTIMKSYLHTRCFPFERTGEEIPGEETGGKKYTIITSTLNAVVHLEFLQE